MREIPMNNTSIKPLNENELETTLDKAVKQFKFKQFSALTYSIIALPIIIAMAFFAGSNGVTKELEGSFLNSLGLLVLISSGLASYLIYKQITNEGLKTPVSTAVIYLNATLSPLVMGIIASLVAHSLAFMNNETSIGSLFFAVIGVGAFFALIHSFQTISHVKSINSFIEQLSEKGKVYEFK